MMMRSTADPKPQARYRLLCLSETDKSIQQSFKIKAERLVDTVSKQAIHHQMTSQFKPKIQQSKSISTNK
ncbi:hypothetical protein VNO78_24089 [Psophocarpus tetragonolobus]|uniref:Uncharacterized protein n=1 Tax=Psophocarpus tetragonolobus TaxID=3891 RepID=A0AAN9XEL1_PSOTE